MDDKNNNKVGVSFVGLLQIAFIVLKLCKVIKWHWFFVLSPAIITIVFIIIYVIVATIILVKGGK